MAELDHPVTAAFTLKTLTVHLRVDGETDVHDFSDHVDSLGPVPSSQTASWTAGNGVSISDQSTATWTAQLGLVADLAPGGLFRFLLTNEGKAAQIVATFADGSDPMRLHVTLTPAGMTPKADGGITATTVTLPVSGKPIWAANTTFTV